MVSNSNILFFALLVSVFATSCSTKKITSPKLYTKDEIDDYLVNYIKENKTTFNWSVASDELIYSALISGNASLSIGYTISPNGPKYPYTKDTKISTLPEEWIAKRDEIVAYILEKERKYRKQPDLKLKDLQPFWAKELDNRMPNLDLYVTDPIIISELRRDKTIQWVEPMYDTSDAAAKMGFKTGCGDF